MDTTTIETAPAQPPVQPAAVESTRPDFRAFDEAETAKALGRAPAPEPVKTAADADDAPAVDAKTGQPILEGGKPISRRQQQLNDRIRQGVEQGIAEERQKRQELERKLAEIEARSAPPKPAETPKPETKPDADAEPHLDDFAEEPDPYLAYTRALTKWEIKQERQAAAKAEQQQTAEQRALQAVHDTVKTYIERETALKATVPDFEQRTANFRGMLDLSLPLDRATVEAGPHVILHLAEHPEEVRRIGQLAATNLPAALRELGKLEAKYDQPAVAASAPPAPEPKTVSSAPPPPPTLGTRSAEPADPVKAAVAAKDFRTFDEVETAKDLARRKRR